MNIDLLKLMAKLIIDYRYRYHLLFRWMMARMIDFS